MKRKPIIIKHICGHTTYLYRSDPVAYKWAEEASKRTCGNIQCKEEAKQ